MKTLIMSLCLLPLSVGATLKSSDNARATTEPGPIAVIGSGLIFVSLIASSTRKRKGAKRSSHGRAIAPTLTSEMSRGIMS